MSSVNFYHPLTLQETCATRILSSQTHLTFREDAQRVFNQDTLYILWKRLKEKIPPGVLNFPVYSGDIETKYTCGPDPYNEPNFKVASLFEKLSKQFRSHFKEAGLRELIRNRIPVASSEYLKLQEILKKKWEDEALCTLWSEGICWQVEGEPILEKAEEIHLWMCENAPLLVPVSEIYLSWEKLKVIPTEIVNLTDLRFLTLWRNSVVLIDNLRQCPHLEYVDLKSNTISSCESLKHCTKITFLNLSDNLLSDISACGELLELTELYLKKNRISTIDPLHNLTKLQILNLSENRISMIDALCEMTQLTELDLNRNRISKIDALAKCVLLENLYAEQNNITTINSIAQCIQLRALNLSSNQITRIETIVAFQDLVTLHLNNNKIKKIDSLSSCPQLLKVNLDNNEIAVLGPISGPTLRKLSATNNRISTIDFTGQTQLRILKLASNKISRIDSLIGCPQLKFLDLRKNKITELAPLAHLPLTQLLVQSNPPFFSDPFNYLQKLKLIAQEGNLLLFPKETDIAEITPTQYEARLDFFSKYTCLSPCSHFLKTIALEKSNLEKLNEAFSRLEPSDKSSINEAIYKEAAFLGDSSMVLDIPNAIENLDLRPSQSPGIGPSNLAPISNRGDDSIAPIAGAFASVLSRVGHKTSFLNADLLFSDMNLLQRATRKAILSKFDRLSKKSKQQVYREIYNLFHSSQEHWQEAYAPEERDGIDEIQWGKKHAFINILILADAMANNPGLVL